MVRAPDILLAGTRNPRQAHIVSNSEPLGWSSLLMASEKTLRENTPTMTTAVTAPTNSQP